MKKGMEEMHMEKHGRIHAIEEKIKKITAAFLKMQIEMQNNKSIKNEKYTTVARES